MRRAPRRLRFRFRCKSGVSNTHPLAPSLRREGKYAVRNTYGVLICLTRTELDPCRVLAPQATVAVISIAPTCDGVPGAVEDAQAVPFQVQNVKLSDCTFLRMVLPPVGEPL